MRPTCPTQGAAWVTVRPQPVQVRPMRPNIGGDWVPAHFMVLLPKFNHKVQGFSAAIPFCERRGTYSSPKRMVISPGLRGMILSPLQSNKSNRPPGLDY